MLIPQVKKKPIAEREKEHKGCKQEIRRRRRQKRIQDEFGTPKLGREQKKKPLL
jgi:hypothetical protein